MKKKDVLSFYEGLVAIKGLPGARFNYAVSKNKDNFKSEVEALSEAYKESPEFNAYNVERYNLCIELCRKDEEGNPVKVRQGNQEIFAFDEDSDIKNKLEALSDKHPGVVAAREKQLKDYDKLLQEDSDVEVYKISLDSIPEDITQELLDPIYPMIDE